MVNHVYIYRYILILTKTDEYPTLYIQMMDSFVDGVVKKNGSNKPIGNPPESTSEK